MSAGDLLWCASESRRSHSHIRKFARQVELVHGMALPDYAALHRFSVERVDEFWKLVWRYADIIGEEGTGPVRIAGMGMQDDRWFPEARLNFAENMLRPRPPETEVLVALDENGARRALTYSQLQIQVARCQAALARKGVGVGDRVVGYLANVPEAVVAMLATVSLGAIWAVVAPDISAQAAIDRIGQLDPKVLFVSDGTCHGGRCHYLLAKAAAAAAAMPNLRATVVVPNLDARPPLDGLPHGVRWPDFQGESDDGPPHFLRLPFAAPAFIMFTSGTTGKPKCLVHSGGGVLMQFAKEHLLHADIHAEDRLFRHSTTGWMMWNWAVGAMAWKATVILYEGSPVHPSPVRLFDLAQDERLTYFSPSAALLDIYAKAGLCPRETHDLSCLRTLYSGGMRVPAANYEYVYRNIKTDVHFASPSGGTDLMAALVAGDPAGCVRAGEIGCAALGMRVQVLDEDGRELSHGPGEMACASSFPSIPLAFWGDADRQRLLQSYFGRFPGKWVQGDWVERTVHGGYVIHGRSDATIKVRGIRIGTAEIYRPLETISEIEACAAVEQSTGEASRIALFVKLRDARPLDEALCERIRVVLRKNMSAHHVPDLIAAVPDLPRNNAGKVMEIAIRDVVHGLVPRNISAIANPQCLVVFEEYAVNTMNGDTSHETRSSA